MLEQEIKEFLLSKGVSDVGFACIDNADTGELRYCVSIAVRLSDAIIDEITDKPTPTYFNHYRTVNAFIDRSLLELGLFLNGKGYNYAVMVEPDACTGCASCGIICPDRCIVVYRQKVE